MRKSDMIRNAKLRAQKHGLEFDITYHDIEWPERCPVLGVVLDYGYKPGGRQSPFSPSIDRIDPHKGYVPGNVVVMSAKANRIKSNAESYEIRLVADWLDRVEQEGTA